MTIAVPFARHLAEPGMEDDLRQRPEARRTRRAWHFGAIALLLATLGVPAAAQEQAQLVRVDSVQEQPMTQTVEVIGRLVPRRAGSVAARIDAAVDRVLVEVGDRVEQGQVIAILEPESLKARRDQAAGRLAAAFAKQKTEEAELVLSRQELKRLEGLKKSAAFSQARYDDAKQAVAIAEAEVAEAESASVTARADLELAEINLRYAEIRAPYGGVITERMIEAGAYVQVGDDAVRLVADQELELEADVPFQRLSGLVPGVEIDVELDDGTQHKARVRAIVPDENPLTRTRAVRFIPAFGETRKPLAANQSASLLIPMGQPRQVLTVHKDAITKRGPASLVHVVNNGAVSVRPVTLGVAVGSRFEILRGLSQGDVVVVRGNERLQDGQKVRVDQGS
ncbi:MAG: efflux RND transporter periplasmic adaptor subunit [Kiloniellales bacterium]|nr:efflux RND transporter periplasmic adaptor subunit [Kiloniellales bacterium]MDJ0982080.1 efflux RND transporter periplasmic adaptor subunit [Kiloniellales bacterium]